MQIKPRAERTNWPLVAGLIMNFAGALAIPYSTTFSICLFGATIALYLCQIAFNVRLMPRA
jgi:hypothetical protein